MKRMCERNKLLGLILHDLILEKNTKWIIVSMKYLDEVKLHIGDVETKSKEKLNRAALYGIMNNGNQISTVKAL